MKAEERKKNQAMYAVPGKPAKYPKKAKKKVKEPEEKPKVEEANLIHFEESVKQGSHEAEPMVEEEEKVQPGIPAEMVSKEEQVEAWLKAASPEAEEEVKEEESEEQVTFHKPKEQQQQPSVRPKKPKPKRVVQHEENQFLDPKNLDDGSLDSGVRIGINGFERAGRLVMLAALERGLDVAAVNDAFTPAG